MKKYVWLLYSVIAVWLFLTQSMEAQSKFQDVMQQRGLSEQDAMMQTLLDYKQHQEEMHIAVLDHMSKEEIQSVIDEISRFEAK